MCYEKRKKHLSMIKQRLSSERQFLEAFETGDKFTMRSLLMEYSDFLNVNLIRDCNGNTGLHLACKGGHATIAESLLSERKW